jgi:sulfoxide reductase heme-binding subunit YedZ
MKVSNPIAIGLAAVFGLVVIAVTGQIAPAASAHEADLRIWLAARATGLAAFALLTVDIAAGIFLAHPSQRSFQQAKRVYPWHALLWVFTLAFLVVHVVALVVDRYAGVGIVGAIVPGLSTYRTVPVALGTLALDALLITALTARFATRLPAGLWLRLHRFALVVWILAWVHGLLAGTDTPELIGFYTVAGGSVCAAALLRYWARGRSTVRPVVYDPRPEGR